MSSANHTGHLIINKEVFPQVQVLWMQVVFFIFSLFIFTTCLYALIFIRWIYKRRMNEKTEEMVEQYKKEERRKKELDLDFKKQELTAQVNQNNSNKVVKAVPQEIKIITTPCPNQFQHFMGKRNEKMVGYNVKRIDEEGLSAKSHFLMNGKSSLVHDNKTPKDTPRALAKKIESRGEVQVTKPSLPMESRPAPTTPTESRPTPTPPTESRPTSSSPTESRPTPTPPMESRPTSSSPTESHPTPTSPTKSRPTSSSPTESHPTPTPPIKSSPKFLSPTESRPTPTPPTKSSPKFLPPTESRPTPAPPTKSSPKFLPPTESRPTPAPPIQSRPISSFRVKSDDSNSWRKSEERLTTSRQTLASSSSPRGVTWQNEQKTQVEELRTPPRNLSLFPYYVDPMTKSPDCTEKVANARFVNPKDSTSCSGGGSRSEKFYPKGGIVYKNSNNLKF